MTQDAHELRRPGRPRSARAHASILGAALRLLAQEGYRGFSMEAVAAAAGVGKTTVYRRWPSKDALLGDAIASLNTRFAYVDTGSIRSDFRALLALGTGGAEQGASTIATLPQLLGELMRHPELHALFRSQLIEPRRAVARQMLEAAQKRGELGKDLDLDLAIDVLIGPMVYRALRSGAVEPAALVRTGEEALELLLRAAPPTGRRRAPSR